MADQTTIQALLDAASPGDTVEIPNGTYDFYAPVIWPVGTHDNITLQGKSRSGVIINMPDQVSEAITAGGTSGTNTVTVADGGSFSEGQGIYVATDAQLESTDSDLRIIQSIAGNVLTVDYNFSENHTGGSVYLAFPAIIVGYYAQAGGSTTITDDITIKNLTINGNKDNIGQFSLAQGMVTFIRTRDSFTDGLIINDAPYDAISDQSYVGAGNHVGNTHQNHTISGAYRRGVHIGTGQKDTQILNCNISDCGFGGIYFCDNVQYCVVRNTVISGCGSDGTRGGFEGLEEDGGGANKNNLLDNCKIQNNYGPGINGASDSIYENESCRIINCTISGNTGIGLDIRYCTGFTIQNNRIYGNGGYGLYLKESASLENLLHNTIADNVGGGVYIDTSPATFRNCIVWGNGGDAITVAAGESPDIEYCNIEGGWKDTGNVSIAPEFTTSYLLQHISAGNTKSSPLFGIGSVNASDISLEVSSATLSLSQMSARADMYPDTGVVDLGYHYPVEVFPDKTDYSEIVPHYYTTENYLSTKLFQNPDFSKAVLSNTEYAVVHMNVFERSGSIIIDEGRYKNTMSLVGSVGTGIDQNNGYALIFDGNGHGQIDGNAEINMNTAYDWVIISEQMINTSGFEQTIWAKDGNGIDDISLNVTTEGKFLFTIADTVATISLTSSVPYLDGKYHRTECYMSQNSDFAYLYVDGNQVASSTFSRTYQISGLTSTMFVGAKDASTNTFYGHLASLQFQNAVSARQHTSTRLVNHMVPSYWTVSGSPLIEYITSTTYKKRYALKITNTSFNDCITQTAGNFSTTSAFASWKTPVYVEDGSVVFRGYNEDLTHTYFVETFSTTGAWTVLHQETLLGTWGGFVGQISVSGSVYLDESVLAEVTPRRRWDQSYYVGREYSPYTVVVDSSPHRHYFCNEILDNRPGGANLILRQTKYDPAEAVITASSALSSLTSFIDWVDGVWDDADQYVWSGKCGLMSFAQGKSHITSTDSNWSATAYGTDSPNYIIAVKDKNDKYAWAYLGSNYSGTELTYLTHPGGVGEHYPEIKNGNLNSWDGDDPEDWEVLNESATARAVIEYDGALNTDGPCAQIKWADTVPADSTSPITMRQIIEDQSIPVDTGGVCGATFWLKYHSGSAATTGHVYFFLHSGATSGMWEILDKEAVAGNNWGQRHLYPYTVVDITTEGIYAGLTTADDSQGDVDELTAVDYVHFYQITRTNNDVWADAACSTRSFAYVPSGFDPNPNYEDVDYYFNTSESDNTRAEIRIFSVDSIPLDVSLNVYKDYYD